MKQEPEPFVVDELIEIPENAGQIIEVNGQKRVVCEKVVTTIWSDGRQDVKVYAPNVCSASEAKELLRSN